MTAEEDWWYVLSFCKMHPLYSHVSIGKVEIERPGRQDVSAGSDGWMKFGRLFIYIVLIFAWFD